MPRYGSWLKRRQCQRGATIKVKICGLQRPEDAVESAKAGVDFIGLVFVPGRRRTLTDESAQAIVEANRNRLGTAPEIVGLFADQPIDEVNKLVSRYQLDMVQLCGNESLNYCSAIKVPVIKVMHVGIESICNGLLEKLTTKIDSFRDQGCIITLDRLVEGLHGGTGKTFDWGIAEYLKSYGYDFILAGGLTPENVCGAVRRVNPWGIDVSSGVESNGVKSAQKIHSFMKRALLEFKEVKGKKDYQHG